MTGFLTWQGLQYNEKRSISSKLHEFLKLIFFHLSLVQMKDKMVLSYLKLKQRSFKPLKQSMFTLTTKTL